MTRRKGSRARSKRSRRSCRLPRRRPAQPHSFASADAFVWHPDGRLAPVPRVSRVDLGLLKGIDRMRDILIENTERFADGLPANNALLWGARGMGKSSLVKAAHASINVEPQAGRPAEADRDPPRGYREPAGADGRCCAASDFRFIVFCDDLSFDGNDASYKSLKAVLEGGIEGRPDNVILYATSNRRHLLARDMIENERSTAINPGEAVEEKVSLSDRFGLWLGFHRCSQDEYLAMVKGYCGHFGIKLAEDELEREALEWSTTRGSRSGRVAWQFTQELAGRLGVRLEAALDAAALIIAKRRSVHATATPRSNAGSPGPAEHASWQIAHAPLRNWSGSTGVDPLRISKWSCGDPTSPD